jgi:hypothetical protein
MKVKIVKLRYWFLISGGLGLLVALTIVITTLVRHRLISSELVYALWPASIVGFGDPTELSDKIICGILEYGGNFLLYGLGGTLVGLLLRLVWPAKGKERAAEQARMAATFLLVVGCLWALRVVLGFSPIAGTTHLPKSLMMAAFYCCGVLIGPLTLAAGSVLSLRKTASRTGSILVAIGCLILAGFALYDIITGMQLPLQAYSFYVVLLLLMVVSDIGAYKIYRALDESQ